MHYLNRLSTSKRLLLLPFLPSVAFSSSNTPLNFYDTLDLPPSASANDIKASFYRLAKKYHPDVEKGAEEKFKLIN